MTIPAEVSYGINTYQVTELGDSAFSGWSTLTSVTLSDTIERVGTNAFQNAVSLQEVHLPQSLRAIQDYTFANCAALQTMIIPDRVTSIGTSAFANCAALQTIIIPDQIISISSHAFQNCRNLNSINLPSGLTNIYDYAFVDCTGLKEISFPESLRYIGYHAFSGSGLLTLTIPEGTITLDSYAFYDCGSLQSVSFPSTLEYIYEYAFRNCRQLNTVEIPNNVRIVGQYAFESCTSLKTAVIQMTGSAPKTTGKALVKALGTLDVGEKLTLNRKDKILPYSFTIDPKTLTKVPKTVNFELKAGNKKVAEIFSKQYRNKFAILELAHKESYGFMAQITVKVDLKGIKSKNLTVYSYDKKTGRFIRLSDAAPYVDGSGSFHLRVTEGGTLILSEGAIAGIYERAFLVVKEVFKLTLHLV